MRALAWIAALALAQVACTGSAKEDTTPTKAQPSVNTEEDMADDEAVESSTGDDGDAWNDDSDSSDDSSDEGDDTDMGDDSDEDYGEDEDYDEDE